MAVVALVASVLAGTAAGAQASVTIVASPSDQTVIVGQTATFTAAATGDPEPTVQWERSDDTGFTYLPIPGATSTTYSLVTTPADHGAKFRAIFTNPSGVAQTNNGTLVVQTAPVITEQPTDLTAYVGNVTGFSSAATGVPEPTVRWQQSTDAGATWTDIDGATNRILTIGPLTTAFNGRRYQAVWTNAAGTTTSSVVVLTIAANAPAFTQQPASTTVMTGNPVTFAVKVTGFPTPTLQWRRAPNAQTPATDIPGATSSSYTFVPTAADHGSLFSVRAVGNATIVSFAATLTVESPPVITTQPTTSIVVSGANATFGYGATGIPVPTTQWQRSDDAGATWSDIAGATSPALSLPVTTVDDGTLVRAELTNPFGSATSAAAAVQIGTVPQFVTDPADASIAFGDSTTFTVGATGSPTPTLQWQKSSDNGATWTAVSGATAPSLTVTPAIGDDGTRYRAVATNAVGTATSAAARLTLTSAPRITAQPQSAAVTLGTPVTFTAPYTGGLTPVAAQWQRRASGATTWTNVAGAAGDTLTFVPTMADYQAAYRLALTSPGGNVVSSAADLDVIGAPAITSDTTPKTLTTSASSVAFSFAANGFVSRQWQRSLDGGVTWENVGTTGTATTLTVLRSAAIHLAQYRVVLTNTHGTTDSTPATLFVNTLSTAVITASPSNARPVGSTVTFDATVTPGFPSSWTIQWQRGFFNGSTFVFTNITGATSPSYSFTVQASSNGAAYRALITSGAGTATSNTITISVGAAPSFTTSPASTSVAVGATATFTSATSGTGISTRSWQRSDDNGATWATIAGATGLSYLLTGATLADSGAQFRAVATSAYGTTTSVAATLTVVPALALSVTPGGTILQGAPTAIVYSCEPLTAVSTCVAGVVTGDAPALTNEYVPPSSIASGDLLDTSAVGRRTVVVKGTDLLGRISWVTAAFEVVPGGTFATLAPGAGLSTGSTPTAADQLTTTLTSPEGGFARIMEGPVSGSVPSGYTWFGLQTEVTAPINTPVAPLSIVLQLHSTLLGGTAFNAVQVFRGGVVIRNCTSSTTASPDPCVRQRLPLSGGGVKLTIAGTSGGVLTFGSVTAMAPSSPTSVEATGAVRSITATWAPPAEDGGAPITSYVAVATPVAGGTPRQVTVAAPATSATFTSLPNGTAYSVVVKARNSVNSTFGPTSAPVPAVTANLPSAPAGLTTVPGVSSIAVSWTAPASDAPVTSYSVRAVATRPDSTSHIVVRSVTGAPLLTSTVLTGLTPGLSYSVTVTASSGVGAGPASAPVVAVPAIGISVSSRTATEGAVPMKGFIFTVRLSAASATPVTVGVETAHVDTDDDDLYALSTTVTFAPGERSKTVVVYVKGDTVAETDETFTVNLVSPVGALVAGGAGVGTITNDD